MRVKEFADILRAKITPVAVALKISNAYDVAFVCRFPVSLKDAILVSELARCNKKKETFHFTLSCLAMIVVEV